MNETNLSAADVAAVTKNNDGMFGNGNGAWWIIILFLFVFCGWGGRGGWGGGNGSGAMDNYVLTSDFSQLSRQMDSGFASQERRTDSIINGICDLGYSQLSLNNQLGMNMMQGFNATQAQMAQCCCDVREGVAGVNYNMATHANGLSREVERGFCDTQYRDMQNTNALLQSGHADADRIIAKLDAMEMSRKDETIARQNQELFQWQLRSSQSDQTAQILRELGYQCPKPAYVVQPPQQVSFPTNCCGQANYANFGGGCGGY